MPSATPSLQLFSALAVQGPLVDKLLPEFMRQYGVHVETTFEPTAVLERKILDGARPDVIVCISGALGALTVDNVIDGMTITPLVSSGIGVAVIAGAAHPRVGSVDELVTTLLNARAVGYSRSGASGKYFASLLERLGIADEVNAHAVIPEKGFIAETLLDGRADLAVQQLSELATVNGIEIVGPLPEGAQHTVEISAAIGRYCEQVVAAQNLVAYLRSSTAAEVFRRAHLEPAIL